MRIQIHPGDELPIYRQIVRQILDGIASGRIVPGEQLPSHRELAQRLVVAPLTVKKAYDLLESDGAVETRRGQGTFVRDGQTPLNSEAQRSRLRTGLRRLLTDAWVSGVTVAELTAWLQKEDSSLREERGSGRREDTEETE